MISEILEQEFGRQVTVEFTGVLDLESNQEIYRKTMEAAEAAIPKAPPRLAAPAPSRPAPPRTAAMAAGTEAAMETAAGTVRAADAGATAVCWTNPKAAPYPV